MADATSRRRGGSGSAGRRKVTAHPSPPPARLPLPNGGKGGEAGRGARQRRYESPRGTPRPIEPRLRNLISEDRRSKTRARHDAGRLRIPAEAESEVPVAQQPDLQRAGQDLFVHADVGTVRILKEQVIRHEEAALDRVLATVLFTDIVGATTRATELGDLAWKHVIERHHSVVRAMLGRYRGSEVDTAGDGFFATFDGPARGVRCALAIKEAVRPLGLEIRAGLHTGELERPINDKVGGIAVHIGARVGALAGAGEILVSSTVKDLVVGSGLMFEDAGEHELKGVPDRWHLYRVVHDTA
jgi:class 3 adenylate cyclase